MKTAVSPRRVPVRSAGAALASVALAWFALPSAGNADAAGATKPAVHMVVIEAMAYRPAELVVKPGDTVVWSNKDPFPHTVTAPGAFDSGSIAAGASWKHVAQRNGNHAYVCTLHPTMKGSLSVQ